jgi:hypothetical protein
LEKDAWISDQAGMGGNEKKMAKGQECELLLRKLSSKIIAVTYEKFSLDMI